MDPLTAAVWSAVAATMSATTAFLALMVQRKNLNESIRPELLVDGLHRELLGELDVFMCGSIKNVGKGPAFHIVASIDSHHSFLGPVSLSSTIHCTILPAGQQQDFPNVKFGAVIAPKKGHEFTITMSAWDAQDTWHQFRYVFAALPLKTKHGDPVQTYGLMLTVAPGVTMLRRAHRKLSGKRFRLAARALRLPLIGNRVAHLLGWRWPDHQW
jgi:hypothetical protein